ncbi:hypothetical protein KJ564_03925, partial [bacterium]|nr:hypothetical protein [bacterium]
MDSTAIEQVSAGIVFTPFADFFTNILERPEPLLGTIAFFIALIAFLSERKKRFDLAYNYVLAMLNDLEIHGGWLKKEYHKNYRDKSFLDPFRGVYKFQTHVGVEIVKSGIWDSIKVLNNNAKCLREYLQQLNSFNDTIEYYRQLTTSATDLSLKAQDIHKVLNLKKELSFGELWENTKRACDSVKNNEKYNLLINYIDTVQSINMQLHVELISDRQRKDGLHSLWYNLQRNLG